MASRLPYAAHGDTLPVTKIETAYAGTGEARHVVGAKAIAMLLFDHCAHVPITIPGLDIAKLPTNDFVTERNMKMQFLVARFRDLVIEFSGGDYGAVRYKGTASGVEFLNLTPQAAQTK